MTFFPSRTTFVSIAGLDIQWYAILILTGFLVTAFFSVREMKKAGYDMSVAEDLALGCLIAGIIGARLWFCVFYDLEYYLADPIRFFQIRQGGLAIQGGLILGTLYGYYYTRKRKIDFMRMADMIVPHILIAQAIGRWGNFVNQEAHGDIVSEAYFSKFPTFIKEGMFIQGQYYEPTFLYESILNLIGFIVFVFILKKLNEKFHFMKRGDGLYFYLVWYGASRYLVEGLRTDSLMIGNFRMAQLTSIAFIAVGIIGYLGVFRKLVKKEKPVVLFDLDGTLLHTEPAILETYRYLFEKYKTEDAFTPEIQLEVLGPSLEEMFKKHFADQDTEKLIKEYREYNFKIHPEYVTMMENTEELLGSLKQQGYSIGVVSTKFSEGIQLGLKQFGLEKYVDTVVGLDQVEKGKPNPEGLFKACQNLNRGHDNCIYVGDSSTDIRAAKNAGMFSVAYLFHPEREEKLQAEKPNRSIRNLIELEEILKEDHAWTRNMM